MDIKGMYDSHMRMLCVNGVYTPLDTHMERDILTILNRLQRNVPEYLRFQLDMILKSPTKPHINVLQDTMWEVLQSLHRIV